MDIIKPYAYDYDLKYLMSNSKYTNIIPLGTNNNIFPLNF